MDPLRRCFSQLAKLASLVAALALFAGCSGSTTSSRTCAEIECGDFGRCTGDLDGGPACVCDVGYIGADCSECDDGYVKRGRQCLPSEPGLGGTCADDPCGGNGECDQTNGIVTCDCDQGYASADCSECAEGYHEEDGACLVNEQCGPASCPEHATCDDSEGIISCECDDGYYGAACTCAAGHHEEGEVCIKDARCMANTCNGAGACEDVTGSPVCECDEGYSGENCDECAEGYHEEAGQCLPDEACGPDSCPENATCDDSTGIVTCACNEGYAGEDCSECGDGLVANPAGECVTPCEEGFAFGPSGECEPVIPECEEGHQLVDLSQVDPQTIDPELLPDGQLPPSGFICIPPEVALTCQDLDPCAAHGTCDDSGEQLTCVCDVGYAGLTCADCAPGYHPEGDECLVDESCLPATCGGRGACDDTSGSVDCSCDPGYTGPNCDQCAADYHRAEDGSCVPDETCSTTTCNGHGTCKVVSGLALCTCFKGYVGEFCDACAAGFHEEDGFCRPDEECGPNTCSGHGTCAVANGVASCTCDVGYTGDACEECAEDYTRAGGLCVPVPPDDECGPNPCNGRGTCDDSSGEALCTCEPPYAGVVCQSCIAGYVKWPDGICRRSRCGDGIYDFRTEECDDGTLEQENCEYGEQSCEVCGGTDPNPPLPARRDVQELAQTRARAGGLYDPSNHCQVVQGVPNYCGDGTLDDPASVPGSAEECDLGALDNDGEYEGCNADCTFALHCGDGIADVAEETCDDGVPQGCVRVQSDGRIFFEGETCEAGNEDGCLNSCEPNECGDTYVDRTVIDDLAVEECESSVYCVDDPEACEFTPDYCTPDCRFNTCGDGYVYNPEPPTFVTRALPVPDPEQCDDGEGNVEAAGECEYGDLSCSFCSLECELLAVTLHYCGDGVVDEAAEERCDDGLDNVDPANPDCPYPSPESCTVCTTGCVEAQGNANYCGDGNVDPEEEECETSEDCPSDGEFCSGCQCQVLTR